MIRRYNLCAPTLRQLPLAVAFLFLFFLVSWQRLRSNDGNHSYHDSYPLSWKHVHLSRTSAGAWYIPPEWIKYSDRVPETMLEAAHFTASLAAGDSRTIPYSDIPLIIHQTWKDTDVSTWEPDIVKGVEQWLTYATAAGNASMAYFLWLDEGCKEVISDAEPDIVEYVDALPLKVEKSDVFRVVVLNSIGGIYGDIDTLPLRSPATWLDESDVSPWTDPETGRNYSISANSPIRLLLGIEGDNSPDTDSYWRMGYNFPVQLTQWALASAPQHPILNLFISNFAARIKQLSAQHGGHVSTMTAFGALSREDPLQLTGPEAITVAAKDYLERNDDLRWNSLTGLSDGGRSKAVGDTLIFPITAFSPGRGWFGSMGSKPVADPDARILHLGKGSWKKINLKVELGKLCRTMFGYCRDWSKVP